jgi:hypothetical protein
VLPNDGGDDGIPEEVTATVLLKLGAQPPALVATRDALDRIKDVLVAHLVPFRAGRIPSASREARVSMAIWHTFCIDPEQD